MAYTLGLLVAGMCQMMDRSSTDSTTNSPAILFGLTAVAAIFFIVYLRQSGKRYNYPPGPKPWPIFGNLLGKLMPFSLVSNLHSWTSS